jgi:hypothetical protein
MNWSMDPGITNNKKTKKWKTFHVLKGWMFHSGRRRPEASLYLESSRMLTLKIQFWSGSGSGLVKENQNKLPRAPPKLWIFRGLIQVRVRIKTCQKIFTMDQDEQLYKNKRNKCVFTFYLHHFQSYKFYCMMKVTKMLHSNPLNYLGTYRTL